MKKQIKRAILVAFSMLFCVMLVFQTNVAMKAEAATKQSESALKSTVQYINNSTSNLTVFVQFAVDQSIHTYKFTYNASAKTFTQNSHIGGTTVKSCALTKTASGIILKVEKQWGALTYNITPSSINAEGTFDPTAFQTFSLYGISVGYDVTLNANGGTINEIDNVRFYPINTGATLPTAVSRPGYVFEGWYANSSLTGDRIYSIPSNATGAKTYYAKWSQITETYNVSLSFSFTMPAGDFFLNTLYVCSGNQKLASTEEATSVNANIQNADVNTPDFKVYIYIFQKGTDGFNYGVNYNPIQISAKQSASNVGGTTASTNSAMPSISYTYSVNKALNKSTVTYNVNGGNALNPSSVDVNNGSSTKLPTPTRTGYVFNGWYTAASGGNKVGNAGDNYVPSANVTLYAQWTSATFTVTLNKQNGTGGTNSVTVTNGSAMPSATIPTRSGYTFGGYFDGVNGNGMQYYNAKGGSVISWNKMSNATLYAYWIPIPATAPTITSQPQGFDANYGDGGTLTASASAASGHTVNGYQWYSSKTGSTSDGEPIASATAATYTIPKTQDVGTYYYYCVATSKRTDNGATATTATNVVTVKLAKINSALTKAPLGIEGLLYTSEAQALVAAGTATGGTVWYKLGSGSYATTIPTATLVDTYTIYYKVVGDKNHYDIAESSLQVKIAEVDKTALKAAIDAANNYVAEISENYSGIAATLSLAIGDANTLYTNKNVTAKQVADKTAELLGKIDEAKAGVTMAKISAIGTVTYTTDCKGKIDAARDAYDALTDAQKKIVTNYKDLTDAEAAYAVAGKIAAIDEAVTPDSKAGIDAARTAYNNLTGDQKGRVGNYKDLTDAEAAYAVAEKIDAIDEIVTLDSKAGIDAARGAYDKLTDDQNVRVGNYGELTDSEAAYAVAVKIDAIGEVVYPHSKPAIDAARKAYADLTEKQQEMVGNFKVLPTAEVRYQDLENIAKAGPVKRMIDALGNVTYPDSKEAVESAREAYEALTEDQKSLVNNYDKLVAAEDKLAVLRVDYDVASDVDARIDAIGTVSHPDSKGAIDAARNAYNALTDSQKALVSKLAVLTAAETEYERLNDIALAKDATEKINAIGTVDFTTTTKARIDAARKAYNAMSAAQKALVENEAVLLAAEAEYEQLAEEAGKARLEQEKVAVTTADGSLIPVDIELKVEVKTDVKAESSHEDYSKAVAAFVDHNEKIAAVYDVKLVRTINGVEEEIQPSDIKEGTVIIVEMAIPEEEKGKEFKILHIHSEDDIEVVEYTIENGNIHVHVDRLSQFAFVNAKDAGRSNGTVIAIVIASIIVAAGLFFLFFFLFKRRKEDDEEEKKTESKTKAK